MGLGHLGVPWGWVSWGVRRWGCGLGLDGVLGDSWMLFSGGGMRRCWGCLCRRRMVASLAAALFRGCVRGGGLGDLGALCLRVWGYGWAWGLGLWLCAAGSMGWCMRLGPGSGVGVFDASCLRRGGGSNRGGVNGLYLGVLLSYVVWELTGWWGGVVFPLLWGLVGPGLPWPMGLDGPGPPALGRFGVTGVPMGVSGGAGSRGGGILPPLMLSSPSLRLHLPLHHTNT